MHTFNLFKRGFWLGTTATLVLALLATGCNSSGDSGGGTGTLGVALTDDPACGFDQVNVTVSKVRVHQSATASDHDAGWTEITLNTPRKINLLDLNDPTQPNRALLSLGDTPLAAGHYTQVRLVLEPNTNNPNPPFANSVVLSGTIIEIPLATPSGIQTGIKLIHQFEVGAGQRVDLVLEFDACKSVVARNNGTYALQPVIQVIPTALNGIQGFVDTSLLASNVAVSAQSGGTVVRAMLPNTQTGEFFLARLTPGTYDVVITADGHAVAVITAVPVLSESSITPISTSLAPFSLQASTSQSISGTVTLNPADDVATVLVAAQQTLNPGPTVAVQWQVAMLITGNPTGDYSYALTLPIGAPSLGLYSSTLPIVLSAAAQSAVAGIYTVKSSGTDSSQTPPVVYGTQTPPPSPVNITGGPATENFTLTSP
jgi:uncharacterized protein DUF4382